MEGGMENFREQLYGENLESGEQSPDNIKETRYRQTMSEIDNIIKEINIPDVSLRPGDAYGRRLHYDDDMENLEYPECVDFLISKRSGMYNKMHIRMESLYPSDTACEAYLNILKKLQDVRKLRLGEERLPVVLQNLELKRQGLHNEVAGDIQERLNARGIAVDHAAARKLFELLFLIWQHSQEKTIFRGEELNGVDLEELHKRIHDETGIEADISGIVWGFHANDPQPQYNIKLEGEGVNTQKDTIERIINEMIAASKKNKPDKSR